MSEEETTVAGEKAVAGQNTTVTLALASIEKGLEIDVHGMLLSTNHDAFTNLPTPGVHSIVQNNVDG